jgi:phosphinothricin acetyltransferase
VRVRDAAPDDLPAIREIYARAAETTPATFDFTGPTLAWWEEVLADEEHLLLVANGDAGVLGYARTSQHKVKPAYATTCETSVYVAETARGRGVGHALYAELLGRLEAGGVRLLAVAGIALPNDASERLHRAHGFTEVGTFHSVGVKFGREWDVRWYERSLRRR